MCVCEGVGDVLHGFPVDGFLWGRRGALAIWWYTHTHPIPSHPPVPLSLLISFTLIPLNARTGTLKRSSGRWTSIHLKDQQLISVEDFTFPYPPYSIKQTLTNPSVLKRYPRNENLWSNAHCSICRSYADINAMLLGPLQKRTAEKFAALE